MKPDIIIAIAFILLFVQLISLYDFSVGDLKHDRE